MQELQKLGGAAAWIAAATYLIVMGLLFTVLSPFADDNLEIGQFVAFAADKQALVFTWNLIAYIINGVFLVILILALHERLKAGSPAIVQAATVFGLIWAVLVFAGGLIDINSLSTVIDLYGKNPAQAATFKLTVDAIVFGINSSDRLAGGLWILLISWAALRSGGLPRALNAFGLVLAVTSLVSTALPFLREVGSIAFGLGIIVWWLWLGLVLLSRRTSEAAHKLDALPLQSAASE
jgi:hypothetical protein